jgi:hypothetical protein
MPEPPLLALIPFIPGCIGGNVGLCTGGGWSGGNVGLTLGACGSRLSV